MIDEFKRMQSVHHESDGEKLVSLRHSYTSAEKHIAIH